jgi:hypothetical protein
MILRIPMSDRCSAFAKGGLSQQRAPNSPLQAADWPFQLDPSAGHHDRDAVYAIDFQLCLFRLHRELKKGTNLSFRLAPVRTPTIKKALCVRFSNMSWHLKDERRRRSYAHLGRVPKSLAV